MKGKMDFAKQKTEGSYESASFFTLYGKIKGPGLHGEPVPDE